MANSRKKCRKPRELEWMDHNELIPRNKFDYERAEQLKKANKENVLLVLPQLLEWLRDINWPIAQDIEDVLVDFEDHLIPHIRVVLNSDDGGWKFSLLYGLITRLSNQQLLELKNDLLRMKYQPTKDEEAEDFEGKVDELLARIN